MRAEDEGGQMACLNGHEFGPIIGAGAKSLVCWPTSLQEPCHGDTVRCVSRF